MCYSCVYANVSVVFNEHSSRGETEKVSVLLHFRSVTKKLEFTDVTSVFLPLYWFDSHTVDKREHKLDRKRMKKL
jgi:hypothetical protein